MSNMSPEDQRAFIAAMEFLEEQNVALDTHTIETFGLDLMMKDNATEIMFGMTMISSALIQFLGAAFNISTPNLFEAISRISKEKFDQ